MLKKSIRRSKLAFLSSKTHASAVKMTFILGENMTHCTITFHLGTEYHKQHNERDPKICDREKHINPHGVHENWINDDIRTKYDELFGDALKEYNAKQKQPCRRITDYYEHIKNSKQANVAYECIVGFYGKDEDTLQDNPIPKEECKAMLNEYLDKFIKDNPNLCVIGAYYHDDELGKSPHLHLDFIPIAKGKKNGLKLKNALDQALIQQGYKSHSKSATAQQVFTETQRSELEKIANRYNTSVIKGTSHGRKHFETETYKKVVRSANLKLAELGKEQGFKNKLLKTKGRKIKELAIENEALKLGVTKQQEEIENEREKIKQEKTQNDLKNLKWQEDLKNKELWQKSKGYPTIEKLENQLETEREEHKKEIEQLKQEKQFEIKQLKEDKSHYLHKSNNLSIELRKYEEENALLNYELNELKEDIYKLYKKLTHIFQTQIIEQFAKLFSSAIKKDRDLKEREEQELEQRFKKLREQSRGRSR